MSPEEYEEYVAKLVKHLECFRTANVSRGKRFPGIRQPGNYEIDVSVEMSLGGGAKFLFIVECKNWARPVDRPVVQKLAQTRDAIGAHKAAIASPIGFTAESVLVAEANGIALWMISEQNWKTVLGGGFWPSLSECKYEAMRVDYLACLGFDLPPARQPYDILEQSEPPDSYLLSANRTVDGPCNRSEVYNNRSNPSGERATRDLEFYRDDSGIHCVGKFSRRYRFPLEAVNSSTAAWEIAKQVFETAEPFLGVEQDGVIGQLRMWLNSTRDHLLGLGLDEADADDAVRAVALGDEVRFLKVIENAGADHLELLPAYIGALADRCERRLLPLRVLDSKEIRFAFDCCAKVRNSYGYRDDPVNEFDRAALAWACMKYGICAAELAGESATLRKACNADIDTLYGLMIKGRFPNDPPDDLTDNGPLGPIWPHGPPEWYSQSDQA